ncbi:MAG: hypothetical protein WD250_11180 [Egibacteraceae bacterium]
MRHLVAGVAEVGEPPHGRPYPRGLAGPQLRADGGVQRVVDIPAGGHLGGRLDRHGWESVQPLACRRRRGQRAPAGDDIEIVHRPTEPRGD